MRGKLRLREQEGNKEAEKDRMSWEQQTNKSENESKQRENIEKE